MHLHQLEDPIRFAEVSWNLPLPLAAESKLSSNRLSKDFAVGVEDALGRLGEEDDTEPRSRRSSTPSRQKPSPHQPGPSGPARDSAPEPEGQQRPWPELHNDRTARDAFLDHRDLSRRLLQLGQFVHGEIRLRSIEHLLLDRSVGARATTSGNARNGNSDGVRAILERLSAVESSLPGSFLALELAPREIYHCWLEELLAREETGNRFGQLYFRWAPEDLQDARCRPCLEMAADLYCRGAPVDFLPALPPQGGLPRNGRVTNAFFGRRRSGLLAMTSKVTVNLPQAAFRSAKRRSGRIEDELDEILDLAIKALLERRQFLARLGANRENPLWDVLGRPQESDGTPLFSMEEIHSRIGILGLNECVKFLTGYEFFQDPKAIQKGREIIHLINRKILREQRGLGLLIELEETMLPGASQRLENIDRKIYPQFDEIERGRSRESFDQQWNYTGGVRVHPAAPVDPLRRLEHLAALVSEVSLRGVLDDSPELRGAGSELLVCLLEEAASFFADSYRHVVH